MSNYATLKAAIQSAVYTNNNNEITGAGLQAVLLQIVNTVGDGYVFKGVATAGTSPGTPDANVFYIAAAGTYTNFGETQYTVNNGELGVFTYNGSWTRISVTLSDSGTYYAEIPATSTAIWYDFPSQIAGKKVLMRADVDMDSGIRFSLFSGGTQIAEIYRGFWQHLDLTSYSTLRFYVSSTTAQTIRLQIITSETMIAEMERVGKILQVSTIRNTNTRDGELWSTNGSTIYIRQSHDNGQQVFPQRSSYYKGLPITEKDVFFYAGYLSQIFNERIARIVNDTWLGDILRGVTIEATLLGNLDNTGVLHVNTTDIGNRYTDYMPVTMGTRLHYHGGYSSGQYNNVTMFGYYTKNDSNTANNIALSPLTDSTVQDYIVEITDPNIRYVRIWGSTSYSEITSVRMMPPKNSAYDVVVDATGNGDFTDLYEAIKATSYMSGHASIYVKAGSYEMPLVSHTGKFAANRKLSIIGESKESVIIYNNDGAYTNGSGAVDSTPLRLSGQVTIKNVTIRSLSTEYSGSGRPSSYCVHVDFAGTDGDIMEIDNCRMYNDHYACIGIGLRSGFTLKIRNCELYSKSHADVAHLGWNGAIICHDGSTAGNPQRIEMYNNLIECTGDHAVSLLPAYNNQIDALFIGNAIFAAGTPVHKGSPVVIDSRTCLNNITIS